MPQLTIYNNDPANVTLTVINGAPPADQSALVASLTANLATRTTERDAALAKVAIARADAVARKTADAAKVEGDDLITALDA